MVKAWLYGGNDFISRSTSYTYDSRLIFQTRTGTTTQRTLQGSTRTWSLIDDFIVLDGRTIEYNISSFEL